MLKFAVLGSPISHSLSPKIHNLALSELGINGRYEAIETDQNTLKQTLTRLHREGYLGVNLTSPLKNLAFPLCIETSVCANQLKTVNVLKRVDGGWYGDNTDVYGFRQSIELWKLNGDERVCLLGGGGAAIVIASVLIEKKLSITVCLRSKTHLDKLGNVQTVDWEKRIQVAQECTVLINATPIGMKNDTPLPLDFPYANVKYYFDVLYFPIETPLLKFFRRKGVQTQNGIQWFFHQAEKSFEIWTGQIFPDVVQKKFLEEYAALANSG